MDLQLARRGRRVDRLGQRSERDAAFAEFGEHSQEMPQAELAPRLFIEIVLWQDTVELREPGSRPSAGARCSPLPCGALIRTAGDATGRSVAPCVSPRRE
jgi:hypothetical protein